MKVVKNEGDGEQKGEEFYQKFFSTNQRGEKDGKNQRPINLVNPLRLAIIDFLAAHVVINLEAIPYNFDITVTRRLLPFLGIYMPHWKNYDPYKFGGKWTRTDESLAQRKIHSSMYNIWRAMQRQVPYDSSKSHQAWVQKVLQYENELREQNEIQQIPGFKPPKDENF